MKDENCIVNEEFRRSTRTFLVEIYLSDSMLDLSDYKNPVKKTLKKIYTISSFNISKLTRISLQTGDVLTSDNWFSSSFDSEVSSYISFGEGQETGFVDRTLANSKRSGAAIYYEFSIANVKQIHERRYEKLYDVLAKIGGLMKILLIFGQFFVGPFSHSAYHRELAEALGVIPDKNQMTRVSLSSPSNRKTKQSKLYLFTGIVNKIVLSLKLYFKRQNHYKKISELIQGKLDLFYILKQLIKNNDNNTNSSIEKNAISSKSRQPGVTANELENLLYDKRDQKLLINLDQENILTYKKESFTPENLSQKIYGKNPERGDRFMRRENSIKRKEGPFSENEIQKSEPEGILKTEEGSEGFRKNVFNTKREFMRTDSQSE
jgi:hypothetical protein